MSFQLGKSRCTFEKKPQPLQIYPQPIQVDLLPFQMNLLPIQFERFLSEIGRPTDVAAQASVRSSCKGGVCSEQEIIPWNFSSGLEYD